MARAKRITARISAKGKGKDEAGKPLFSLRFNKVT